MGKDYVYMYILHTKWAKIQYPIGSPFRLLKRTSVEKNKKLFHTLTGIWLDRSEGCGNLF